MGQHIRLAPGNGRGVRGNLSHIGPQIFLSWNAPRYFIAFATHLGCYTFLVIIILSLRQHLIRQNKKKDRLEAEGISAAHDDQLIHAFEDFTDRGIPTFAMYISGGYKWRESAARQLGYINFNILIKIKILI